jgi:hypothetical protein
VALIKGLFSDMEALATWLEKFPQSIPAITAAQDAIMDKGMQAVIYGEPVADLLRQMIGLALSRLDEGEKEILLKGFNHFIEFPIERQPMSYEAKILEIITQNPAQSAADFQRINDLIKKNNLSYRNIFVRTLAVPKILTKELYSKISEFIAQIYPLFDKIIEHYFLDPAYRKLFGFAPELEELILISRCRKCWIPMARIDFFLNEADGSIMMCEINTDGTSAMNEDRLLGEFLEHNTAFQTFMQDKSYRHFELFDSWVQEFLEVYRAYMTEKDESSNPDAELKAAEWDNTALPRVAIVDFLDIGYLTEFEKFREKFIGHGIETEICDIRDLAYDGRKLRTKSGMIVDAVYRRAVTSDIMARYDEVKPFLQAVKDRAVCLVGDFVTQIIHNKRLFYILYHPATKAILSPEELTFIEKHFPATFPLTAENITANKVYENREQWIIKPCDSYGAKGFYSGINLDDQDWKKSCEQHLRDDYVLQKFNQPYKTPNLEYSQDENVISDYSNLTGVFCYNGKPYGIYSRMASGEIISTQYDERTIATVCLCD